MRPSVLERIEKKSKGSRAAARARAAKHPAQRGPKNRPTYRLWEYATWRLRMRAWCNSIKSVLLGARADPLRPQGYKVVQSEKCPIDNVSTWLTWWAGDAVPRPTHVGAAERIAPGSSRLIDLSEMGTPELRHLVALDILNTKFRQSGRPSLHQRTQSQLLLTALNEAWAPFLSVRTPVNGIRFALETQIGQEGATLVNPVDLDELRLAMVNDGRNLRRFALPLWSDVTPKLDWWVLELAESLDAPNGLHIRERLRAARLAYYGAFAGWGIAAEAVHALNADTSKKTWDGSFSGARARI